MADYPASNLNDDTYQPGTEWKLVWSDEFADGAIDPENWTFQVEEAERFNEEWQRYTGSGENAYVEDNCLVIRALHESDTHGTNQYTSARLHTANKQSWRYGKIAARIQLPYGQGIWPAFWMLGANMDEYGSDMPWPQVAEIDILEMYGSHDDAVVEGNLHYADASDVHAQMGATAFKLDQGRFADAFHVLAGMGCRQHFLVRGWRAIRVDINRRSGVCRISRGVFCSAQRRRRWKICREA